MQRRATIWILGAFKTSSIEGIEAIADLIPIKLHFQKLMGRSQLHPLALPHNHLIWSLIDSSSSSSKCQHPTSLSTLTDCQRSLIKGHLVYSNNKLYGIFPSFSPLHLEFSLGSRIIDNFLDCFSFNLSKKEKNDEIHLQQLNNMVLELSSFLSTAIVVMDASIKNNIATSISHMHLANHLLTKTVHYAAFVTSTEAKLFMIRYGINQACIKENVSKIIVITNSIYVVKNIFNTVSHPYQSHAVAILSKLHCFFASNQYNSIEFWEYPSQLNWNPHKAVNRNSKSFNPLPVLPSKMS